MILTTAIALKTRSPALSTTAFVPLIGPAYLAHTLRSDHKPENTINCLKIDSESATTKNDLPTFKHGLLNYDWAPELHIVDNDMDMFRKGRKKFSEILKLIWTAEELEKQRKIEAKAKAKAKAEGKARKRKEDKAAEMKSRDDDRRRRQGRSDDRAKTKVRREKKDDERRNKDREDVAGY